MTRSGSQSEPPPVAEHSAGEASSEPRHVAEPGAGEASSEPRQDAEPGESGDGEVASSSSGDPLAHALRSSSSWSSTADVELQRDLLARRMFEGAPVTIDRFEVEALVGAGASAAVYAARDPLLGRRVALKVLARARSGRVAAVTERLIREARALAQLSHRNVVTIYEVGQWNDRPFIAMELIEGTTLARWLAAERRSVAAIRTAFVEAGRGLVAAHASGHVHRDFKPANVLVAHDGRVVVSDFGLVDDTARDGEPAGEASDAAGGSASRPSFVGTPAYVAPEQRAGAAAHPSADVYSFALALVEALLGYHPMPESTVAWQAALRGRVPRRLHHEICAALAPQPQQRTPSLGPLLDALAVRRDIRPRRLAAALAIGSTIAFVIGALWSSRGDAPLPGPPLPSPDPLLVPAEIFQGQQALLGTPAEARDDTWAERARTWLMLPIPGRVPCRWSVAPSVTELVGDHVVALDSQGLVTSCAIRTGIVSVVASDVMCVSPVDETTFGVELLDRRIALYQHGILGWRSAPFDGPLVDVNPGGPGTAGCQFDVSAHGLVRPRLFMPKAPPAPKDDRWLFARGDRTVAIKVDGSIYAQSGDTPPVLVDLTPRGWGGYGFDERLHYLALSTPTHVRIHDLDSRSVVAEAPAPWTRVNTGRAEISRDGSTAVAVGLDGPLLWWRRGERGWHSQPIAMNRPIAVKVSALGDRVLIVDSTGGLEVLELVSGRRYPLASAQISKAEFLGEDQVVAIDEAGAVWRWSLPQLRSSVLADHVGEARMWGFATCDGGSFVLTASNRNDRDILLSAPSGAPQTTLSVAPGTQIFGLACQGDLALAGTGDGHLLAWDRPTGRPLFAQDLGVRAWVWSLATAQPTGGPLVALIGMGQIRDSNPRSGGRVLALRDGALTTVFHARYDGNTGIDDIAVSADGRHAAVVASSGELALIDVAALTLSSVMQAHTVEAHRVRFSEGDRAVVTAGDDGYLRTWTFADGLLKLHAEVQLGFGRILDLDVRGTMALVATRGGHVGVWDLKTQRLVRAYAGHSWWVITARFDTSGQWIASGDQDGRVCLHHVDRDTCDAQFVGHQRTLMAHVRFLDDGQLVTVSEDGTARQWNPPYRESNAELACELEERLFDHGAGAATRDCGPGMLLRLLRAP